MSPVTTTLLVILVIIILIVLFVISCYNKLIQLKNHFKNAFAQIDVQLLRRHELIPNLVETAKGYMKHEKDTFEAVVNARNMAVSAQQKAASDPSDPKAIKDLSAAEGALSGTLGRLFALAEAYPDLKANENMMQLSEELTSTENKISFARQAYNDSVMKYNTAREVFPANQIAGMFNFSEAELFLLEEPEARTAPKVSFT